MEAATDIQRETLVFINNYYMANGFPPSIQEIAKANKVACNAIQGRITHLERKGYITKKANVARSIVLTNDGLQEINTPRH